MSLPEVGTILRLCDHRSFNVDAAAVHHRISIATTDNLEPGEILIVLDSEFVAGGWLMMSQYHFTRLIVVCSKGVGWVWCLTAKFPRPWIELDEHLSRR